MNEHGVQVQTGRGSRVSPRVLRGLLRRSDMSAATSGRHCQQEGMENLDAMDQQTIENTVRTEYGYNPLPVVDARTW